MALEPPGNESGDSKKHLFSHGVLENLIQALSDTDSRTFEGHMCLFSRTFQALKIWKKSRTFKDPQEPCNTYVAAAAVALPKFVTHIIA